MSNLTYTSTCIAFSDKIKFEVRDVNDSVGISISKNETTVLNLTLSRKQLDLLLDDIDDYLDAKALMDEIDDVKAELERFWGNA